MSKKWLNPPLSLQPRVVSTAPSDEEGANVILSNNSGHQIVISPSLFSVRDSSLDGAQYATAGPVHDGMLDLPSAVPFQEAITPALPSAEFPSSVRGFASPPVTSSTMNFGTSPSSIVASYLPSTPVDRRLSTQSSDRPMLPVSADVAASGATGANLHRTSSQYSTTTIDSSDPHFPLDITQFPRPPLSETSSAEPSPTARGFTSPAYAAFLRKTTRLNPPASPLYEVSEPSTSRPLTPVAGNVSYRYPFATSDHHSVSPFGIRIEDEAQTTNFDDGATATASLHVPPSPALTPSNRGSYNSHLTVASQGSSTRHSLAETFGQNSPQPSPAWDQVLTVVKPDWNSSDPAIQPHIPVSPEPSSLSTKAAVGTSTTGRTDNSLVAPTQPSGSFLSPMSGESSSDVYSAIGRMDFPRPPSDQMSSGEASSPVTPGPPRSPWVTGVTLKSLSRRGSANSRRRHEDSPLKPLSPVAPPLPIRVVDMSNQPSSSGHAGPTEMVSPVDPPVEFTYPSGAKESAVSHQEALSVEQRSSKLSVEAPSYDRRLSDLVRGMVPAPRESVVSAATITTDSDRSSVDGAVVGVARTASLSARAKALLTRGPSIGHASQDTAIPYLVPSPLPSAALTEDSATLGQSNPDSVAPLKLRTVDIRNDYLSAISPLHPPPPIKDMAVFPESVRSGSFDDVGSQLSLQRYPTNDIPHSAVPLNQSTPFQNQFPTSVVPTSFRSLQPNFASDSSESPRSRSPSKRRSNRSSVMSSLTRASSRAAKAMSFFRRKPLPPLPTTLPNDSKEKKYPNPDENMSAPDPAVRAAVMDQYLAAGDLPYKSPVTSPTTAQVHGPVIQQDAQRRSIHSVLSSLSDRARANHRRARSAGFAQIPDSKLEANLPRKSRPSSFVATKRRRLVIAFLFLCVCAVGIAAGVIFGRPQPKSDNAPICEDGAMTGASCQINATCVCTSKVAGRCSPVAQGLLDLLPSVNQLFNINATEDNLALTLWDLQGQPASSCASQAVLVDVAPALNQTTSPNRTEWARAAILYNLLQTVDLDSTARLRKSVSQADFSKLPGNDGPVTGDSLRIVFESSGFMFDFASMSFLPGAVEWKEDSGVNQTQAGRVGFVADRALDRMYSFSSASSVQRSTALARYWAAVLQLPESDLGKFTTALANSPVLLPFNTFSSAIVNFLNSTTDNQGISLPAPVACLTSVQSAGRNNTNIVEQNAYGLEPLGSAPTDLQAECFPNRPVYGVLDPLRLRRPFSDNRNSMRIPAAQLIASAAPRVVLHTGEQLVGLAGSRDEGVATQRTLSTTEADPRNYGTMTHLNHVALSYLQSFSSPSLAAEAARYILTATDGSAPPNAGDALFDQTNGFANLPVIEVAVFGTILPDDIDVFHADFGTPNGTLFFGSKDGDTFRQWALRKDEDVILWSESASASQAVHESRRRDTSFESIWDQATALIEAAAAVGRGTGAPEIRQIVKALEDAHLFT
ncbi:SubName: Full=Uncharacterized protein {ECO:0000313/EMBL:CCA67843.1} [Serendipita indica DSM 11827]|nr:SubName: Full=Uncharacterized protein {ECO:0000313/EMBL:CCA67843.1} [Serendipita indica DSM 11827]